MNMAKQKSEAIVDVRRRDVPSARLLPMVGLMLLCAAVMMAPTHGLADDCITCHQKYGVKILKPSVAPIKLMVDGKEQRITLDQGYAFHGHECPGMAIAYRAVQYGLDLLFPDKTPDRNDLLITSKTSAAGVKDFIDLVMKGDNPAKKTWPPVGLGKSRDGFAFLLVRKSTCQAVEVKLLRENFPADFYPLKGKLKDKTISPEEWNRLHGYFKKIILEYPTAPAEKLFGKPTPYKMILWGTVLPGEQDKNIRNMRQKEKRKKLSGAKK